jgi:hypothetical protein
MGKSGKLIIAIIVVLVIAGGAYVLANKKSDKDKSGGSATGQSSQNQSGSQNTADNSDTSTPDVTITYDGGGFSLTAEKIKAGSKVRVVNDSDKDLNFDSDPHPVHTDNPELNAGDIAAGDSKTFTLNTKGTWGFHNHLNSSQHGELTVE